MDTPEQVFNAQLLASELEVVRRRVIALDQEYSRNQMERARWCELRDRLVTWCRTRVARVGMPSTPMAVIATGIDEAAVYVLVDPEEPDRIRYVGQSTAPHSRYKSHLKGLPWAAALVRSGRLPVMLLVEWTPAPEIARDREAFWIHHYRGMGMADLNTHVPALAEV